MSASAASMCDRIACVRVACIRSMSVTVYSTATVVGVALDRLHRPLNSYFPHSPYDLVPFLFSSWREPLERLASKLSKLPTYLSIYISEQSIELIMRITCTAINQSLHAAAPVRELRMISGLIMIWPLVLDSIRSIDNPRTRSGEHLV